MVGLYLHIPFCRRKCNYCDFASVGFDDAAASAYLRTLDSELTEYAGERISTAYIGGGTPTVLSPEQLERLCSRLTSLYDFSSCAEFTVEANPESLTPAHARALRSAGANRLSIGLQSLDDRDLTTLGRVHSAAEARQAYAVARTAGFENVSIDLMYGLPGQTAANWEETLQAAVALRPEHLSLYPLTIEEGTPFHRHGTTVDEDLQAELFDRSSDFLERAGYEHYEISNWSLPGFASRHNLSYWENKEYIGVGAAAASYRNGVRSVNCGSVEEYIGRIERGESPVAESEDITPDRFQAERIILGLRCSAGVTIPENLLAQYEATLARLAGDALIEREGPRIRLTRRGMFLANQVMSEFV